MLGAEVCGEGTKKPNKVVVKFCELLISNRYSFIMLGKRSLFLLNVSSLLFLMMIMLMIFGVADCLDVGRGVTEPRYWFQLSHYTLKGSSRVKVGVRGFGPNQPYHSTLQCNF